MSANIIIKLVKKAIYTMTFPENTEVELVVASNSFVRFINPFIQPSGVVNIIVGTAGDHSSFGSISTNTQTTPYFSFNSSVTGTTVTYNSAIVIVRYKYTRQQIQPITIDNHFKYISFPNYGTNQTSYSINFQEMTEIQLLLLDDLKYIEEPPFTTNGQTTINVGNPSTFNTLTTNTNSTFYNFSTGYLSTITGSSTGYNKPVVIVRYKYTKSIITQINTYGFLKYNDNDVWEVQEENIKLKRNIIEKSNSSGGTFSSTTYINEVVGMELKDDTYGKLFISTNPNSTPQYTTDTATGAGYMENHLEVDGKILAKEFCVPSVGYTSMSIVYSGQNEYHPGRTDTWGGVKCERIDVMHMRGNNYYGIDCQGNLSVTGTKQFKIPHPILENKSLVHNSVKSPRVENLYRGIKQLINGKCEINMDTDCHENGGLPEGTYQSFNRHSQLFLQNHNTFDRLKVVISGNKINVICEDDTANYEIN